MLFRSLCAARSAKTHARQIEHPLVDRAAAEAQLFGQPPLRRQTASGLQFAGEDPFFMISIKLALRFLFSSAGTQTASCSARRV